MPGANSLIDVLLAGVLLVGTSAHAMEYTRSPAGATLAPPQERSDSIKRGEYVARLGDCIACHSAPQGKPLAGGVELKTPFGSVYSTNITPAMQTGIGGYSFEQFDRAMRKGRASDGRNLYAAMPYPSYAKMSAEDMRALYAYLTKGVAPVEQANRGAEMSWPFSMRWGLTLWNWAFLDESPFVPDPARDAAWNRGAYLVQGPGHCGACHTPRGLAFQEKTATQAGASGRLYLAGETVEAWHALSLRNPGAVEDTVRLLKTGQNRFGSVSGSMVEVIQHSTQHFSDDDLVAVATYLKSLAPAAQGAPARAAAPTPPAKLYATRGGLGYAQFCLDCHRQDGKGVSGIFPTLAQNASLASPEPSTPIHIALTGWKTAQTAAHPRIYTMPAFSRLSDQELAEILNFVGETWGSSWKPLKAAQIKKLRAELGAKPADPSKFETPRYADMLAQANAQQLIRGMRLHLETKTLLPEYVGNELNCTSCHLNSGTVAEGSPFVGVAAFFPSYAPRAGREISLEDRINGCFRRSMHGKPLAPDSQDLKAMVAYFNWMKGAAKPGDKIVGRGVGKIDMAIKPDAENGKKVYAAQCAACHGEEGEGLKQAESFVYPPLWGEKSFNIGAGMARTYTAAAFVKRNMPVGFHAAYPLGQGGLSDQEAVDVAEYFSHQPRPDFPDKVKDWPKDKKPLDSRY